MGVKISELPRTQSAGHSDNLVINHMLPVCIIRHTRTIKDRWMTCYAIRRQKYLYMKIKAGKQV